MTPTLAQSLWLSLPVVFGGLVHVGVIRAGILAPLARVPLDGGLLIGGRPLFGANKTVRGAVVMIGATALGGALQVQIERAAPAAAALALVQRAPAAGLGWGALLGLGYIVGELPNSLCKRWIGIGPGEPGPGALRRLFWVIDQVDSLFGVLVAMCAVWVPPAALAVQLFAITLVLHPAIALLMVALGLKRRVG